jgi:hypothetical protein
LMFTNWLCTYGQSYQTCFTDLTRAKIDLKKSQGKSIFQLLSTTTQTSSTCARCGISRESRFCWQQWQKN